MSLAAPIRPARYWTPKVGVRSGPGAVLYLDQKVPLPPYPERVADMLVHWAEKTPDRTAFAARNGDGGWQSLSYGETLSQVRRLAQFLIDRRLSSNRPLAILSGNDLEHATLALAALHAGIPYAAISPAYSLAGGDYARLREVLGALSPGLVFAADAGPFRTAIDLVAPAAAKLFARGARGEEEDFQAAMATTPGPAVERAYAAITGDTIAKYLFTSGSTGTPKAVIQSNRMICSNQAMIREVYSFFKEEPPLLVDWAPWHHTGGGNKVFHMAIFNGGTLHIDDGLPTPEGIARTVRNLKEVGPNWYFNVPAGYDALVPYLEADPLLRGSFFRDLKLLFYAGAPMNKHTWEALERISADATGARVLIGSGLGATETAPSALMCTWPQSGPGNIGLPCPGLSLKLVPLADDLYDARVKGPSVMPGYLKSPELSEKAFDEEGYYRLNDALCFAEPGNPAAGLVYAGRTNENFKLDTATWVSVGTLRARFIDHFAPLVRDVVLAGPGRPYLAALVFPHPGKLTSTSDLRERLRSLAAATSGSSERIKRMILVDTALSEAKGEITAKGTVNQQVVLRNRAEWVEELYSGSERVIEI